jgi:inner membrane protein
MPSVGHIAVGLAASRMGGPPVGLHRVAWAALLVILSCLPDADVIAFRLGIPYHAPFGHRGAFHSVTVAAACGVLLGLAALSLHLPAWRLGITGALVMASHGLLDTLTDGGLGIALLWPFSTTRYFAPWRPIPVAPIGARLFAASGVELMLHECLLFLPLFVAGVWPRRARLGVGEEAG